ncbi:hypothetical protein TRAPUB_4811 [Trametes pubescens]|uniref:Uncharacterized protein n=1 Tax=Trametes pubescens TaxID=154538 RepID=A0A1M2VA77_TRAPU|nr:hypothetical protein TRAPUB_4811 [Trametes pubescens]
MLVNYTIDDFQRGNDTYPLAYSPSTQWALGPECTTCNIYPGNLEYNGSGIAAAAVDVAQTYGGTWHDTTYHPGDPGYNVTARFVGQAVYVFNIIANDVEETTTITNLVFTLDGVVVGQYTHTPDPSGPKLMYKVPVYRNLSMPHGNHTLTMSAGEAETSLILFDYIIFTANESTAYQPARTTDDAPLPPTTTPTPPLTRSDAPMTSPTPSPSPPSTGEQQSTLYKSTTNILASCTVSILSLFRATVSGNHWRHRRRVPTRRNRCCRSRGDVLSNSAEA